MIMRGWWASLVVGPVAWLAAAPGTARADMIVPGRHVGTFGRTLQDMCPAELNRGGARCFGKWVVSDVDVAPDSVPRGLGGDQIAAAYAVPAAAQSGGAVVAIVDAGGDSSALSDLQAYRAQYKLGSIDKCPGTLPTPGGPPCLAIVNQDGGTTLPPDDRQWAGETSLDLDMVSAACPDCSILLVQASTQDATNLGAAVDYAASVPGVVAISNSYGWPESGAGTPFTSSDASHYAHPGIAILAASGDQDYLDQGYGGTGPSFPASAPTVIGVGGTVLSPATTAARGWSETVWNDGNVGSGAQGGGSGCSQNFKRPTWQTGISTGTCAKTMRASVDVSAASDYRDSQGGGGIIVYCGSACGAGGGGFGGGGFQQVVGTSAATPIVAGILARLGLATKIGADPGLLYANESAFFDIADGSNNDPSGQCQDVMCTAVPGWDGPTGLGTPNATSLASLASSGSGSGSGSGGSSGSGSGSSSGSSGGSGSSSDGGASSGSGSSSGSSSGSGSGSGSTSSSSSSGGSTSSSSSGSVPDAGSAADAGADGASGSNDETYQFPSQTSGCSCLAAGESGASDVAPVLTIGGLALALSSRRRRAL